MAFNNDVPLGQAGTGAAYVLGNSRAIGSFVNDVDRLSQEQLQRELLAQKLGAEQKQQQAAAMAKAFQQNQIDTAGGYNWQPEISKMAQSVIDKGNSLMQRGINPYSYNHSDPVISAEVQDYNRQRQAALNAVQFRKDFQPQVSKLFGQIKEDTDPQFVAELNKYVNTPIADIMSKNIQMPQYRDRFNYNEFLQKVPSVSKTDTYVKNGQKYDIKGPNTAQNKTNLETAIVNDPQAFSELKRIVGIPLDMVASTPNYNKEYLLNEDYYKNVPAGIQELAEAGITDFGEDFKKYVGAQTKISVDARKRYDGFIQRGLDYLNGKQATDKSVTPDDSAERLRIARENLALSKQREARLRENDAERKAATEKKQTYGQNIAERVISSDDTNQDKALTELSNQFKTNDAYLKGLQFKRLPGGKIQLTVPEKYKTDAKAAATDDEGKKIPNSDRVLVAPKATYTIDPKNNPQATNAVLLKIYNKAADAEDKQNILEDTYTSWDSGSLDDL